MGAFWGPQDLRGQHMGPAILSSLWGLFSPVSQTFRAPEKPIPFQGLLPPIYACMTTMKALLRRPGTIRMPSIPPAQHAACAIGARRAMRAGKQHL